GITLSLIAFITLIRNDLIQHHSIHLQHQEGPLARGAATQLTKTPHLNFRDYTPPAR
ncbi:unnamed protein product, partial [Musa acuminata var. zebrina]